MPLTDFDAATPASFRNRLRNGSFSVNQRAVSGTVTLAAGVYGHDGWKGGAGGCTYTFATAANGDVTLTITAGTLLQIIEGAYLVREGGTYAASWSGTATARVYQGTASGSYAASPVTATGLVGGTNTTVEFGTGTLGLVQFEPGAAATPFERRDDEERRCLEYFWRAGSNADVGEGFASAANAVVVGIRHPVRMRSAPTPTFSSITATDNTLTAQAMTGTGFSLSMRDRYRVTFTGPTNFTFGQGSIVATSGTGSAAFSCEL